MFINQTAEKLVILLYHGVSKAKNEGIRNIQGKHIQEKEFYKQMLFLKNNCNVISIDEFINSRNQKKFPKKNNVVITFDDGFENNYSVAAPILEELKLPATFYISSGLIGSNQLFWVDQIEDILERTREKAFKIKLAKVKEFFINTPAKKLNALLEIKKYCKSIQNIEKDRLISQLSKDLGIIPSNKFSENYKVLSWEQLREMSNHHLFTIGGHSFNHNILSSLGEEALKIEIEQSILKLNKELDQTTVHYSYPEGQEHHYNDAVITELQSNGIICSPSAIHGINNLYDDLFHLRRIMVGFDEIKFPYLS